MLGVSSLLPMPYSPWLEVVLFAVMALNAASVWWRCRSVGRMAGFHLVASGTAAIVATKLGFLPEQAAMLGVPLVLAGSIASAWSGKGSGRRPPASEKLTGGGRATAVSGVAGGLDY